MRKNTKKQRNKETTQQPNKLKQTQKQNENKSIKPFHKVNELHVLNF